MRRVLDILKWLLPLVVLLATACGHDDLVPPDVYVEETTPYVEVRIAVPVANPASTRANPMGGEEGNGRERGTLNEDMIHDINVFFYDDSKYGGEGMNSNPNTPIVHHIYYNIDDNDDPLNSKLKIPERETTPLYYEKYYLTLQFECSEELLAKADGLKFLAIANLGPKQFLDNLTLEDLTGLQLKYYDYTSKGTGNPSWSATNDAYSTNASNMDYFLMSTAYNANHTYDELYGISATGDNTIHKSGDKYSGTTTLQRLYARLDLWYHATSNSPNGIAIKKEDNLNELKYQVIDAYGNQIKDKSDVVVNSAVYLTNVLPVNVMQKPSFLFKMVTNEISSFESKDVNSVLSEKNYLWGGKESPNDLPTATSPGDKPLNYVIEPYTKYKNTAGTVGTYENDEGRPGSLRDWYGNTTAAQVKTDIQEDANGKLSSYYHEARNYDGTFGCNHISIIGYANENTQPTDCYRSEYLTGMAFRAVYVPDKEKIFSDYDKVTKVLTKLDQSATSIGGKIYRYSPTTKAQTEGYSLYFTSKKAADDYATDHPEDMAIVSTEPFTATQHVEGKDEDGKDIKKWGFICYYNLWLRHYNNEDLNSANGDPTENYPMEYATVRNNIYRVSVSFRGPGDPTPTMREPDTMKARIFVRKWNYREEDKIVYD